MCWYWASHTNAATVARTPQRLQIGSVAGVELSAEAVRVLGCLVEKELSTPAYYPMTRNSLVLACNQSTNRDPVVAYDDGVVREALGELRGLGLSRVLLPGGGNRSEKFRHNLDEALGLGPGERAVLGVLALRGPQTEAEIRARAERLGPDRDDVEFGLRRLQERDEPLVTRLERQPGQKETRFAHLLSGEPVLVAPAGGGAGVVVTDGRARSDRIDELEARVGELEAQVAELRTQLGLT